MRDDQPRRLSLVAPLPEVEPAPEPAVDAAGETTDVETDIGTDIDDPDLTGLLEINPLPGGVTLRRALSDLHLVTDDD